MSKPILMTVKVLDLGTITPNGALEYREEIYDADIVIKNGRVVKNKWGFTHYQYTKLEDQI